MRRTGVVDENVEAGLELEVLVRGGVDGRERAQVHDQHLDFARQAVLLDAGGHLLALAQVTHGDVDVCAGGVQRARRFLAQAVGRASGHNHLLACELADQALVLDDLARSGPCVARALRVFVLLSVRG